MKPVSGLPPRAKNHGCQGATEDMHGVSFTSHWSETGLVVSGVEATSIRSTLSRLIRSAATSAARFGFDWLSLTTISTGTVLPPMLTPFLKVSRTLARTKLSASPNGASGPVCGLT